MLRTQSTAPLPAGKTNAFASVFALLAPQMSALDRFLQNQLGAFEPEIRAMVDYCIDTSGKRIRPALVFLSGWRDGGAVSPDLVRAAAVVELVHLATLVHDDIMDSADVRRSRSTATREFGPTVAVLLETPFLPTRSTSRPSSRRPMSAPRCRNPPAGCARARSCRPCTGGRWTSLPPITRGS